MKETSPDEPYIDRLCSWAKSKVHGGNRSSTRRPGTDRDPSLLSISNNKTNSTAQSSLRDSTTLASSSNGGILSSGGPDAARVDGDGDGHGSGSALHQNAGSHNGPEGGSQSTPSPQASRKGSQLGTDATSENIEKTEQTEKGQGGPQANIVKRFFLTAKKILLHSWLNVLLVFVPAGIAVQCIPNMSPGVIFALNAIAIIPLAGLLSHATETVAHRMGDAIGALLNITFGNAVELIILYVRVATLEWAGVTSWARGNVSRGTELLSPRMADPLGL